MELTEARLLLYRSYVFHQINGYDVDWQSLASSIEQWQIDNNVNSNENKQHPMGPDKALDPIGKVRIHGTSAGMPQTQSGDLTPFSGTNP